MPPLLNRFRLRVLFCLPILLLSASAALAADTSGSAQTDGSGLILLPIPRQVLPAGSLSLAHGLRVRYASNAEDAFSAKNLAEAVQDHGARCQLQGAGNPSVVLLRVDTEAARSLLARERQTFLPAMQEEGYILLRVDGQYYDIAATGAGIFYGVQTIRQLLSGQGSSLILNTPTIRDWPAMRYRGMGDDLSRGPVPTLAYQEKQIRTFAAYKINLYSPYFENTLQFAATPLAAPPGGAMSRADVETLVRYAQQYHITIVPDQESFGHLHHTLLFEQYAKLAETPHGSVLAPGQPGSLPLIDQWFTEIAQMFPGPFLHIGADETFDLGAGQTQPAVQKEGLGKVYIDFVRQIDQSLQPLHRRILFWGDVAMNSPQLVKTLPKDMIAVAWKYTPQPQGYDAWIQPFTDAGMETWVAPGVSSWNQVYPDNDAALQNIQRFVSDGQRLGSPGELNTAWYDDGEGLFAQTWYGVLFGAAAGWQPGTSSIQAFEQGYGQVFHNDASGKINQAQLELIAAYKTLAKAGLDGSTDSLFWLDPWSEQGRLVSAKLLPIVHDLRIHAENAMEDIDVVRSQSDIRNRDALDAMALGARRLDFIGQKFQESQEILDEYARMTAEQNDPSQQDDLARLSYTISGQNGQCQDLRDGYGVLHDLYRAAWLKENRPYSLNDQLVRYDMNMQLWIRRGEFFQSARQQFRQTHKLPALPIPQ
jgi:hexosaminidase